MLSWFLYLTRGTAIGTIDWIDDQKKAPFEAHIGT